jgi:branched-chain amino acid:cation transporter, LIVCS family
METTFSRSVIFTAGLAIFAMQFGAGNIVFALSAGHFAQDKTLFAILGLIITGVIVPLVGLVAMTLFNGDYKSFFSRVGKVPGFILTALMLSLLGPFGATPRCIALSYSTSKAYLPAISLPIFSLICCLFIFLFTVRRTKILDVIGRFLTPLKLGSLTFLIIWGIIQANTMPSVSLDGFTAFFKGFTDGYQTMDLLGAFFICSVVLDCLKRKASDDDKTLYKSLIKATLKASCIGSALLALIYVGFSYTAAYHSHGLDQVSPDELVSRISMSVLGAYGGIFVCFAVTIACLTTAIALSTIFAEFLHKDISRGKVSYPIALAITLAITFVVSTLDFTGIIKMLTPILHVCYPALIVLSILNIMHKLLNFQPVKIPVLITFCVSLLGYLLV